MNALLVALSQRAETAPGEPLLIGEDATLSVAETLAQVVEARYRELFSLIQAELRRSGFENMIAAGLVMTGGASRIEGAEELAEELFHMPVRLATPQHVSGLSDVVNNAIHATGVGLVLYGSQADPGKALLTTGGGDTFFDRVRSWFRGEF